MYLGPEIAQIDRERLARSQNNYLLRVYEADHHASNYVLDARQGKASIIITDACRKQRFSHFILVCNGAIVVFCTTKKTSMIAVLISSTGTCGANPRAT